MSIDWDCIEWKVTRTRNNRQHNVPELRLSSEKLSLCAVVLLRRSCRNCGAFRVITKLVSSDKQKRRKAERGGWMEGEEEHFCVLRLLACVGVGGVALNSWTFRDFSLLFPTSPSLSHIHHAFCLSIPFHTRIMNESLCCYTVSAIYVIIKYEKTIVQSQIFTRLNDVPLYHLLLLHLCLCVLHPEDRFSQASRPTNF